MSITTLGHGNIRQKGIHSIENCSEIASTGEKIKKFGWSRVNSAEEGRKIVWITPQEEIKSIISAAGEGDKANKVCDHVGFSRNYKRLMNSPKSKGFVIIHYSSEFSEEVYQPNCSNADWAFEDNLFISYPREDGFGRTYHESATTHAREQIHQQSFYFDDAFKAHYLGEATDDDSFSRDHILDEALERLWK